MGKLVEEVDPATNGFPVHLDSNGAVGSVAAQISHIIQHAASEPKGGDIFAI